MSKRETVVVVCPGRGSYGKEQLGYLAAHTRQHRNFVANIDQWRAEFGVPKISELDAMTEFSPRVHSVGKNAAALIYGCALVDFRSLDQSRYEIVAITGNSMGWYLALAAASVLSEKEAFSLVQIMGSMMGETLKGETLIGGQLIYPVVDEQWRFDQIAADLCENEIRKINQNSPNPLLYPSIDLGGYRVIGGDIVGLKQLAAKLPKTRQGYPMILPHHAAFHTPLLTSVSQQAFKRLPMEWFTKPRFPLIDGRGHIWQAPATSVSELWHYTLGHQVTQMYDFTASIRIALREFAPDRVVLLGPGESLGSVVAQIMIQEKWRGVVSKSAFKTLQAEDPFVLSFSRDKDCAQLIGTSYESSGSLNIG